MGIRGCKSRKTWSSMTVIALACLLAMPVTTGQTEDGDDGGAIDGPAAPNPIPVLSISLFPTQLEAQVTADQLGTVTFDGTVTVEQVRIMTSTVTMTAVVSTGWPVVLSPQSFDFTGSGTESFSLTIIVPPATNALLNGNALVTGACKAPALSPVVASASAVVTVGAYYDIAVGSHDNIVTLSPGEGGEATLTVGNRGNGIATVSVSVGSAPQNMNIELSDETLEVYSEDFENLTVKITATDSAPRGTHEVLIYFTVVGGQPLNGDYDSVFSIFIHIPTLAAAIGYPVIAALVVLACVGVAVFVLWKKGKLSKLREIRLPKRTKA